MSRRNQQNSEGEFLWLVSLSDLMILLFVFFVLLFSFSVSRLDAKDFANITEQITGERAKEAQALDEIQARLLKWVVDKRLLDSIEVKQKEDSLILEIRERLLFPSGNFEMNEESRELVALIGNALRNVPAPYRVGIEGHTDDVQVHNKLVEDNWDLSAKRARSVLKALDLKPDLLVRAVVMGYGEMRPMAPNRRPNGEPIPENQSKNRRVTIRIF
jgi:chemotaxis protein MotB